jgi:hypothetical protein
MSPVHVEYYTCRRSVHTSDLVQLLTKEPFGLKIRLWNMEVNHFYLSASVCRMSRSLGC